MDENQAVDICISFKRKQQGKNVQPKFIDLVKSYCNTKDKDILKKLEDIPFFEMDNDYIRINNILVSLSSPLINVPMNFSISVPEPLEMWIFCMGAPFLK